MPYSNYGKRAKITKPADVERLYLNVKNALETALNVSIELTIEKDRPEPGLVQETMFRAIYDADVLIADLTGSNANVFFELGLRYGVKRNLTILTSQDEKTPFDVVGMRVIRYGRRLDQDFTDDIIRTVKAWLENREHADSPMFLHVPIAVVPLQRWQRVSEERVSVLLENAGRAQTAQESLALTERAIDDDPFSSRARVAHVRALRSIRDYRGALSAADAALPFFPRLAELHKERGLALDRLSEGAGELLDDAVTAIERAIHFDPADADGHCCLGGVLRRRSIAKPANAEGDLRASLAAYQAALEIDRHSTYAGLNLLRLLVMLSPDRDNDDVTKLHLRRMSHLCEFEVSESLRAANSQPWWTLFDLADTMVLSERPDEGIKTYDAAIEQIPGPHRAEVLLSPFRMWREMLATDRLGPSVRNTAEELIKLMERFRGDSSPPDK